GRAVRVDVEPQFRGSSGTRRPDASGVAGCRGRDGDRRPICTAGRSGLMRKVSKVVGTAVVIDRDNIDTDQIIPSRYLKKITRTGYADGLFAEWRKDPAFPLNDPGRRGASILITGANFGCGSSREHAAWALDEWGFRAIIAP